MGYTWTDGELITATKLNNTGGGGTSGLVTDTSDELDKSYNEIMAMVSAGTLPFIKFSDGYIFRLFWIDDSDGYGVAFSYYDPNDSQCFQKVYFSSTADGTLVLDE